MTLKSTSLISTASLALLVAGCGGSSSSTETVQPPTQTLKFAGGVTAAVTGTVNPPVTAVGNGAVVTGVGGGTITALTQDMLTDDLANTQILFNSSNATLSGVAPDGTGLMHFPYGTVNSRAVYSPDGTTIAYAGASGHTIQFMSSNGLTTTNLSSTVQESEPFWSPSGDSIVYEGSLGGNYHIYTKSRTGANPTAITGGVIDVFPSYAPDNYIFFTKYLNGIPGMTYIFVSGGAVSDISFGNSDTGATVSPHGTLVAFLNGSSIWTATTAGTNRTQITNPPNGTGDQLPYWSPDGSQIVYQHNVNGRGEIWVVNVDGTNAHRVLPATDEDLRLPTWSPFFRHRSIVGPTGFLSRTSSGFLLGTAGTRLASILNFDCPAAYRNSAVITNETAQGVSTPNLVFSISATSINVLSFVNGISQVRNLVVPSAGITTATGALVTYDSTIGEVTGVMPYASSKALGSKPKITTSGGVRTLRGHFLGVFDRFGKNVRPRGATVVRVDTTTGKLLGML